VTARRPVPQTVDRGDATPRRGWLRRAGGLAARCAVGLAPALAVPGPRGARAADAPTGAIEPALLAALRAGGCVLVIRHAATEPGVGDPPGFRLDDCATQRNLSEAGRVQARRLGERLRAAGVPVDPVRSSRWCRCLETARLAFGRVQPWPVLDSFFSDRGTQAAQTDALRAWALAFRGQANAALVTHQVNGTALTGEWSAAGEVLVLRPDGTSLRLVGRLAAG
jgi:phosphohistidine phosphatase SixA